METNVAAPAAINTAAAVDISGEDASVRPIITIEALTDQEF